MSDVNPSGRQVRLTAGGHDVTVVEVGAGLRSYELDGWAVVDGYGPDEMCSGGRGQHLVPWPNRLARGRYSWDGEEHQLPWTEPDQGNAIHGLVRWHRWVLDSTDGSRARFTHRLFPEPGYPFLVDLAVEYEVGPSGLTVRTEAVNAGDTACPFGAGAHPYVSVGTPTVDDAVLRAPAGSYYLTDDQQIPVGTREVAGTEFDFRTPRPIGGTRLDTGYCDLGPDASGRLDVELTGADGRRVVVWLGPAYRYLMLFTGDTLKEPDRRRRGLGVEPMTCPPNAFATGEAVVRLEPGGRWVGEWGISPSAG